MLKPILAMFSTGALSFFGATASAQLVFDQAEFTFKTVVDSNFFEPDLNVYEAGGRVAFSLGEFGVQADFGISKIYQPYIGMDTAESGIRVYRNFGERVRIGLYDTAQTVMISDLVGTVEVPPITFRAQGVEAMIDFGKLNLEIAVTRMGGLASFLNGPSDTIVMANVYYEITNNLEVEAGYWAYLQSTISGSPVDIFGVASIAARYQPPNLPVSIGAEYEVSVFAGAPTIEAFSASISFHFGPNQENRMFGRRDFNVRTGMFRMPGY